MKKIGGWDPFNVTEDCDLGMRIAREGKITQILGSTTWEEAPSRWKDWYPQRTRWLKGYIQTFLVHTRSPWTAVLEFGPRRYFLFLVVIGGQVGTLILSPLIGIITLVWFWLRWPIMDPSRPWTRILFVAAIILGLFNLIFIFLHLLGAYFRKTWHLALWALMFPLYWLFMSAAAWRGLIQFFINPFHWEKTSHGLAIDDILGEPSEIRISAGRRRALHISATSIFLILAAVPLARLIENLSPKYCFSNILRADHLTRCTVEIEQSWLSKSALDVRVRLPSLLKDGPSSWHLIFKIVTGGGEVFYQSVYAAPIAEEDLDLHLPFDEKWQSTSTGEILDRWQLSQIRRVIFEIADDIPSFARFDIRAIDTVPDTSESQILTIQDLAAPSNVSQHQLFETQFKLSRYYDNPFDPEIIDVWLKIRTPEGKELKVPAFFSQDFQRRKGTATKPLLGKSPHYWAARFNFSSLGKYEWQIDAKDNHGGYHCTPLQYVQVSPAAPETAIFNTHSDSKGYLVDGLDHFIYPLGLNIGWPLDQQVVKNGWPIYLPTDNADTDLLENYISRMPSYHMNIVRIWMTPWWGGLEWNKDWPDFHGLKIYSLTNAWRIDQILEAAEKNGVLVDLVLEPHGSFGLNWDSIWKYNPYNLAQGGFLSNGPDTLINPQSIKMFENKYRYIIARYGSRPSLLTWSLINEANATTRNFQHLASWHTNIIQYFKKLESRPHLFATGIFPEISSDLVPYDELNLLHLDWIGSSGYNVDRRGDYKSEGTGLVNAFDYVVQLLQKFKKNIIINEYGGSTTGGSMNFVAHEIHDGLWLGWVKPLAYAPLSWWWSLIFEKDLLQYYAWFNDFIKNEDLRQETWAFQSFDLSPSADLKALGRIGKRRAYIWIYSNEFSNILNSDHHNKKLDATFGPLRLSDPGPLFPRSEANQLALANFEPGRYRVEYWDTWGKGKLFHRIIKHPGGKLHLPVPPIERDLAIKFYKTIHENETTVSH